MESLSGIAIWLVPLALILVVMTAWFVRTVQSTQYSSVQTFFWIVARCLTRFLWRTRIQGEWSLPDDSNGVVICNHRSSVDPFFVQVVLRRVVHWMVAREYCEHRIFGFFLHMAEVIPVNRGGIDTASTKAAIRIVADGGIVGMLPEGRINTTSDFMLPVRPGAIMVALRARAPIIPCYVEGAPYRGKAWSPFLMRAHVRIRFGQPIDLSDYFEHARDGELVRKLMKRCVLAIAELAGRSDFEPQFAGRRWKPGAETEQTN